jgi:hypothetical protein
MNIAPLPPLVPCLPEGIKLFLQSSYLVARSAHINFKTSLARPSAADAAGKA